MEETEKRLDAVLAKVPVSRISDVSLLVHSGIPVFSATTPLAKDLTTQLGKGVTERAARISALMEAVERVSAESVRGEVLRASFSRLVGRGCPCVDPASFDLPPESAYHPDLPIDWVAGWDIITRRETWIPVDLCVSPPDGSLLDQVDTNGLAAGSSFGEAIRHALLEVIERDATSQIHFFELFGDELLAGPPRRPLTRATLPEACAEVAARIETETTRVALEEITSDVAIPVIACHLHDAAYPAAEGPVSATFGGWGCDTDPVRAAIRALTEAHQSRIGTIQSARDSFNVIEGSSREFTRRARAPVIKPGVAARLEALRHEPADIANEVETVIRRLRAIGVNQVVVVNMRDPALGIPVVRVRVPGLSAYMVDRRRLGWRCMRHLL
jgi:YcaO-like protein with predicted kinase domain